MGGRWVVGRRTVLRAALAAGTAVTLPGCASEFAATRLRIATGSRLGV